MSTKPDWRAPCEVCGLYELEEHFDQAGDWCDGAGARLVTPKMLVAALIAKGGEIVEMNPCCTASDGRAMMSPKGDVVSGNGECAEFLLPPGSYVLFGPISAEKETTT